MKASHKLLPMGIFALGCALSPLTVASPGDSADQASLQRGADLYMHYCSSCHSLKYLRYDQIADDLTIPQDTQAAYLKAAGRKADDPILAQLDPALTAKAYGATPPDLTLITQAHSPGWVYQYLLSFYPDSQRPSGSNNHLSPNVAMPDVLADLHQQVGDKAFKAKVADLVIFLTYAAEPAGHARRWYGVAVLAFLMLFLIPIVLLHRDYWRDID